MEKQKKIPNMQRRRKEQTPVPQENAPKPVTPDFNDDQIAEFMAKAEAAFASSGSQTRYFIHDPMGLHSQQEPDGTWLTPFRDGLGSVRGVTDEILSILESRGYDPFGNLMDTQGTSQTPFGFTGEMTDPNGLIYLRNRYYDPSLGVFPNLDPVEGTPQVPMSLNRYSYAQGNPVNLADPSGTIPQMVSSLQSMLISNPMGLHRLVESINSGCYSTGLLPRQQEPGDCSCYAGTTYLATWCQEGIIPSCLPQPTPTIQLTAPPTATPRGRPTPYPTNTPRPTLTPELSPTPDVQALCDQLLLAVAVANEIAEGGPDIARIVAQIGVNRLRDPGFSSTSPTVRAMIENNQIGGYRLLEGFEGMSCQEIYDAFLSKPYIGDHIPIAYQAVVNAWYGTNDPTYNSLWFLVSNQDSYINNSIKPRVRPLYELASYPGCAQWWMNQFPINSRPQANPHIVNVLERNGVVLLYTNFVEPVTVNPDRGFAGCTTYCTDPNDSGTCGYD